MVTSQTRLRDGTAAPAESASVRVVRAIYDAHARGDFATLIELFHPDVEIYQTEQLPWGGRYAGRAGLQQFVERLLGAIESQVENDKVIEAGDRVITIGRTRGRPRAGGRPFEVAAVHIFTVVSGQVRRYEAYIDTPAMLHALAA